MAWNMESPRPQMRTPIEASADQWDEPDERANRNRMLALVAFVSLVAGASLLVYLSLRPPNRHLEPTPYDGIVSQLRKTMTEAEVLELFRAAGEGVARGEVAQYDETPDVGSHHVLTYRIGSEEPLKVRFNADNGHALNDWCFRDHCYDNIE